MRIKSYFAQTVEGAVDAAREELGPEAMLVDSRRAPPESRHLGEYEVVFGLHAPSAEAEDGGAGEAAAPSESRVVERITTEVAELKKELEAMRWALTRSSYAASLASGALAPNSADALAALAASDMPPDLAQALVQAAEERLASDRPAFARDSKRADGAAFRQALIEELESRLTVQPTLGRSETQPRLVALVGPPGSGKTTTLVKLAVNYGLACRRPAMLLSTDSYRVGAAEQLRSYAAILGVGFQLLETVTALAQAIEEHRAKDLILIDTPGFACADLDPSLDLARFLASRSDIDTHLVLPASMKSADLSLATGAFESFRPQRLLFSKLDETGSFGPLFGVAALTSKPLSFFTVGQRIPEDIEAASRTRLIELVLAGPGARIRSAA
jgi:flagellar biosynthesis protein FlhF